MCAENVDHGLNVFGSVPYPTATLARCVMERGVEVVPDKVSRGVVIEGIGYDGLGDNGIEDPKFATESTACEPIVVPGSNNSSSHARPWLTV